MSSETPPIIPDEVEKLTTGLNREWYYNRRVVLYKLVAASPQIVDTWASAVLESLQAWERPMPYLALHDLSQAGVSLQYAALVNFDMLNIGVTPEGRILVERLFDEYPDWRAKVAVNFNLSLSGQTNRTLMNYLNREHPAIRYKTFYNRAKCLKWLVGEITDTNELQGLNNPQE
ncbi:MAG: hypothetical protein NZ750_07145 [Anaerolineae bacterium]|nr:hypothetical protein [Anaerolineae bacterium]MDW8170887.1 hypothetical protein [Anaerolineae bacterium]